MRREKSAGRVSMKSGERRGVWRLSAPSGISANGGLPDYRIYELSVRETVEILVSGVLILLGISWLFYRTLRAALLLSPLLVLALEQEKKRRRQRRQEQLARQFQDGMQALASAMSSGFSAENAFRQARRELIRIYGENSMLAEEFAVIGRSIGMNRPVEEGLRDLAERSGLADVEELAEIFAIAKRSGGSLPRILRTSARTMEEKNRVREEIRTLMASKRLEQRIMCLMPAGILIYVGLASPSLLSPLYQGPTGRVVMTVCLAVYILAVWWGEKIMEVEL